MEVLVVQDLRRIALAARHRLTRHRVAEAAGIVANAAVLVDASHGHVSKSGAQDHAPNSSPRFGSHPGYAENSSSYGTPKSVLFLLGFPQKHQKRRTNSKQRKRSTHILLFHLETSMFLEETPTCGEKRHPPRRGQRRNVWAGPGWKKTHFLVTPWGFESSPVTASSRDPLKTNNGPRVANGSKSWKLFEFPMLLNGPTSDTSGRRKQKGPGHLKRSLAG